MTNKTTPHTNDWRDSRLHRMLGMKAGREAGRVLAYFERERPDDARPREAVEGILAWASGQRKLDMKAVRRLSLAAHAAARAARTEAATAAARAAGQAVATWHAPAHSLAVFHYAQKAIDAGARARLQKKTDSRSPEELTEALRALNSLISKCVKVQKKLQPGSAQATLMRNRLKAFRLSVALIKRELITS